MVKSRKRVNKRPDIIDVVTGITEEDTKRTETRIAAVVKAISEFQRQRALLLLQRQAEEIYTKGVKAKIVTVTCAYNPDEDSPVWGEKDDEKQQP